MQRFLSAGRGASSSTLTVAELVAVALLDGEGDEEALAVGREFGHRREDAEVGIAFRQIEAAQQLAVEREAVRIVGSSELRKRHQRDCLVRMTSRSVASLNALLPMKWIVSIEVTGPSLISKTTSTRFCGSWMIFGSTVAAKRPLRR